MHASFLFFDLSSFPQFVVTAFLLCIGFLHLLKTTASRYFAVDAKFNGGGSAHDHLWSPSPKSHMIAASDGGDTCFVCGSSAVKRCSRCKAIRYCSSTCQLKHWKSDHRLKCKDFKSFYYANVIQPASATCERRKAVGLASIFNTKISSAPARGTFNVLQQPKKVLFPYDEFIKLFNWDSPGFPPCGLLNCGNSCFANVVLQCLTCTKPLVAYLMEKGHSKQCNRNDWCFLCELQLHVHRVSQSLHPFSPLNILSRLPNIGGNLGHGKQEDAHEFMRFAIDTMQSVCLDSFGGEKVLDLSAQETTLIQNIFGGHLQSQVMCTKCEKVSYRYENMMDLTVEIQGVATSLEDCLDQFTAKEWLDGENMYKCDGCSDYVKAWKQLTVHQAPNILTIALKRFQSGSFGKLNKRVTFPETLDLGLYMSEVEDGTDLYRLYAVVVHVDMLNASSFGHYICYTKDFQGNWYWIDDCKVMKVELDEVLSQDAYMLLYSRLSARPFGAKPQQSAGKEKQQSTEVSKEPKQALVEPDEANPVNLAGCLFTDTKLESPAFGCERVLSAEIDPEDIIYGGLGCPSSSSGSAYLEVGKLSHCSRALEDVSSECCDSNTSSNVNSISKYEKGQDEEFQLPEPSVDDPDPSPMGRPSCDSFTSISDSRDMANLADAPCSEQDMVTWSPISPNAVITSLTVSQATENAKFESSTMYGDESCTGKNPMQLFSCRFLDKHATKKPLCKGEKARMNPIESGHSCIVDQSCNGLVELVDAGCSSTSDSKCDGYSTPISIHQNGGVINGDLSLGMEICETSKGFDQSLEKRYPNENEVPEKETIVDQPCYADCSGCVGLFPDRNDSKGLDQSLEKRFLNENEVPEKESIVDGLCYADCDECAGPPFPDQKGSDASRQDIGPETLQHDPMDLSVFCKKKSLHMDKEAGGNANDVHSIEVETSSIVWVGPVITDKNGGGAFMHDRPSTPLCENGNAAILECGKPLTSSS